MDRFEDLLKSLSTLMGTPLAPDEHSTCLLMFENGVSLQLEIDKSGEFLVIGSMLGELPPGKYREQVLIEALKHNRTLGIGVFAYSLKKNQLVLFERRTFDGVEPNSLYDLLKKMVEKSHPWKEALSRQERPPSLPAAASLGTSIFGP